MSRRKKNLFMILVAAALLLSVCSCGKGEQTKPEEGQTAETVVTATPVPTPIAHLILVNRWNPISDSYAVDVRELPNHQKVAVECYDDLMAMLSDCKDAGMNPEVCSGFRTIAFQQSLYEDKVERVMAEGHLRKDAEKIAATEVAEPGTSEHHTGLAVDIIDKEYAVLDETQEQRATQQWLLENSWKYGFVLRYPTDKTDVTGIIYEPWHYRYVGKDVAKIMYKQDLCLEEYINRYG